MNQAVYPFDEVHVKEPRRREVAVSGLNDQPFRELINDFERLQGSPLPCKGVQLSHARLVTSPQPGYGKSHLIARLFRELHGKATMVYVLPFQNSASAFQSLMLAIARELHFPDRADTAPLDPDQPTQFDLLAHGVLAHLLADLVEMQRDIQTTEPAGQVVAQLRVNPLAAFNRGAAGNPWADCIRQNWETKMPLYSEALVRRGVTLAAGRAWLRVLFGYAFEPFNAGIRQACLDWMTGQPLGADEMQRLGLRASEGVDAEVTAEQANDICRTRLTDLCQLARFYRPFVFSFDQTEVYGHHPRLARSFGMVVAALVNEATNHLTLVTSNQDPWTKRIAPHIEDADLERFANPPVVLEGLNRRQGEELVRLRFAAWNVPQDMVEGFLDRRWMAELFPTERNQMGARHFLQKCRERWKFDALPERPMLSLLYRQQCEELLATPKRLLFEPDTLHWLVEEAARGVADIEVEPGATARYFPVRWNTPSRVCLFGFEPGAHWKRWQTILQVASQEILGRPMHVKAVFFRTPEMRPVPGPGWRIASEIDQAKAEYLDLITLTHEDLATLYAAKDLFAEAAQGDIPYNTDEVLAFLREQLSPWWARLRGPIQPLASAASSTSGSGPDEERIAQAVREVVQRARSVSVEEVIGQIGGDTTKEQVLTACGATPAIRVHSHPDTTVLQWQSV